MDAGEVSGRGAVARLATVSKPQKQTYLERPDFEAPRRSNRMLQAWTQCRHCSRWYAAPQKEINRGRWVYCTTACSGLAAAASGKFAGENNPRWLGGVSNDNMRYKRRAMERHPVEHAARKAVYNAVKAGRLPKQPCEKCGAAKAQAHHEDYSKPLDVRWLCRPCHDREHGKLGGVAA